MTLRLKALLIVGVTLVFLLITLYLSLSGIWLRGFAQIESQQAYLNVKRVTEALDNDLKELQSTAADWASWDETYQFVEEGNETYIQTNLEDAAIANLQLNVMVFIHRGGRIVYDQGLDLEEKVTVPVPDSLRQYLAANPRLFQNTNIASSLYGIVVLPENPLLLATHPILDSHQTAPSRGTLLVGRFLNTEQVQRISTLTHLAIAVYPFSLAQLPSDFQAVKNQLDRPPSNFHTPSEPQILIRLLSHERIAGYTLIKDIQGQPGLLLRVDIARDIYQRGQQGLRYLVAALLIVGVTFGMVTLWLLEKWVLLPLARFLATVKHIRSSGNLSERLLTPGNDELSRLGIAMNQLLATLQESQRQLRQSQERYQSVVDNVREVIFQTDAKGRWMFLNPAWTELTGFSIEESLGLPFWKFIHPEDRSYQREKFHRLIQEQVQDNRCEIRYQTKEGAGRIFEVHYRLRFATDGAIAGIAGTLNDISDRKLAEAREQAKTQQLEQTLRELTQTQAQLIQSEKMSSLGQLVAGVAHEINNPVSFVSGNLEHANHYFQQLLDLIDAYQQHYPNPPAAIQAQMEEIDFNFLARDLPRLLDSMQVGADRISEIVKSLRNFSRLDEAEVKRVDIHEGLDSNLMILQHKLKAQGQQAEIQIFKEYGNLPKVECYPGQLNQVFMNLLTNAIDALEEKRVTSNLAESPWIRIRTEVKDAHCVLIRIADNGTGMTETTTQRLFDPFFTTKPVGKGTGLGLSISYQIVLEKHKGQLLVNSELGIGTEFTIELPTSQSEGDISYGNMPTF
ncbi:MAG TPA: hypothetical protein DDZ80_19285 [Cyanobacteria bacterium UBA8803]|nr:hypothetical protein [Cyanobacteria bacterium UBA9273]HBL60517.1 hypothetical protein [Cyanobacteria bacterium UBA8803]